MTVLPAQRSLFDLPDGVTYLNCANMSPQLRGVTNAGVEAVRRKRQPWRRDAADWFSGAEARAEAAAAVLAKRDRGEPEQFILTFTGTDLRAHDIPGEFPPEGSGSSIRTAMQSVAFSYIDPAGQEWAGPGRVHVESFTDDGVLTATFDAVTLPHTDKELPDITLTDGHVRATL